MSRGGEIDLDCWDGTYSFRLRIGELRQLQERCNHSGPPVIAGRLQAGQWLVDDVRETLRLGLMGAGTAQDEARKLVDRHVHDGALASNVVLAYSVVMAAIHGVEDERLGKRVPAESVRDPMEHSPSPASTQPEP
ncbi:hypothetical protein NS365_04560 [Aureimonas ureilytica]|uniref:Gene transfer agent protein n=1 Tax=Aureimonas ureilytica TaxID=401562 RepID=A0A175RWK0_9HYPH|nr:gene transfer agent family protein [Aureimonas ureilytica]KTR07334.1 hypothetical protein NS365_04560 [Aureimonas ureilytica]